MNENAVKVTIAGGGASHTPGIIQALLESQAKFPVAEIRLYDIDEQKNDDMYVIIKGMLKAFKLENIKLIQTTDPEEGFKQVDFVFSQIRVGDLAMREKDEKIPLKYGLVGQETCGAGGFAYGLRSIKGLLEIVEYVQEYAPDAWILNYTNPESLIAEAVRRKFPHAKMLNACDMTISIEETICRNFGYDRKNWIAQYYGLNHFGWYTSIYDKSLKREVMPEIIEKLQKQPMKVASFNANDQSWQNAWNMLSENLRLFPDYLPNNYLEYYLFPDVVVKSSDSNYTRANYVLDTRVKENHQLAEELRAGQRADFDFDFGEHGNYIVDMAASILNDSHERFMLILPNTGSISNLRHDAVVEVPAYVGRIGAEPVALKEPINNFHKGLMEAQDAAEKLLVDAYFEHSYQKALQAFTLNLAVPSADKAKQVLDALIVANKNYWPKLH
ncbi:6-phospho-alpha-glucosidase [Lactobacillus sp. ESL0791]|uniref:family 4 glycosyl hydrolase n=1 Tax=Lactobacillus sp. ESL0791 TaxID=2983234 RepID=UPI0023FA0B7A|nr:6-phospho-alpha-glucosidase [Lactobacillus sp. ESL0791]MDF7637997.1 6-phospho-alpha-glucosidase [Lactobacillus sp. ESL0791]